MTSAQQKKSFQNILDKTFANDEDLDLLSTNFQDLGCHNHHGNVNSLDPKKASSRGHNTSHQENTSSDNSGSRTSSFSSGCSSFFTASKVKTIQRLGSIKGLYKAFSKSVTIKVNTTIERTLSYKNRQLAALSLNSGKSLQEAAASYLHVNHFATLPDSTTAGGKEYDDTKQILHVEKTQFIAKRNASRESSIGSRESSITLKTHRILPLQEAYISTPDRLVMRKRASISSEESTHSLGELVKLPRSRSQEKRRRKARREARKQKQKQKEKEKDTRKSSRRGLRKAIEDDLEIKSEKEDEVDVTRREYVGRGGHGGHRKVKGNSKANGKSNAKGNAKLKKREKKKEKKDRKEKKEKRNERNKSHGKRKRSRRRSKSESLAKKVSKFFSFV